MPVIHLVRHGQASFGTDDYDRLSALGERQADLAGRELARRHVRTPTITCGSLLRQRQTASIVATAFDQPAGGIVIDERWNEFSAHDLVDQQLGGPGASSGLTSAEFQVHLDVALTEWIDGQAADWVAFSSGVLDALRDVAASVPRGSDAIVATSAGVTAAVVGQLLGMDAQAIIALNRVSINASITSVIAGSRGLSLLAFNDHAHVAGDRELVTNR